MNSTTGWKITSRIRKWKTKHFVQLQIIPSLEIKALYHIQCPRKKVGGRTHPELNGHPMKCAQNALGTVVTANRLAARLKRRGCDLIVCLSHLGLNGDTDLARKSANIDLIIGGHSHSFLEEPVKEQNKEGREVVVVQTGAYGVYAGRIDITF